MRARLMQPSLLTSLSMLIQNLDIAEIRQVQRAINRDFKIYDAVVNENATKQQCHWLKEEK